MREGLMDDTGYQFDEYEPSEEDIIYHMGAKDLATILKSQYSDKENLIISIPREELDRIIEEEFNAYGWSSCKVHKAKPRKGQSS